MIAPVTQISGRGGRALFAVSLLLVTFWAATPVWADELLPPTETPPPTEIVADPPTDPAPPDPPPVETPVPVSGADPVTSPADTAATTPTPVVPQVSPAQVVRTGQEVLTSLMPDESSGSMAVTATVEPTPLNTRPRIKTTASAAGTALTAAARARVSLPLSQSVYLGWAAALTVFSSGLLVYRRLVRVEGV